jgi:hypothetical protein
LLQELVGLEFCSNSPSTGTIAQLAAPTGQQLVPLENAAAVALSNALQQVERLKQQLLDKEVQLGEQHRLLAAASHRESLLHQEVVTIQLQEQTQKKLLAAAEEQVAALQAHLSSVSGT